MRRVWRNGDTQGMLKDAAAIFTFKQMFSSTGAAITKFLNWVAHKQDMYYSEFGVRKGGEVRDQAASLVGF